MWNSVRRYPRDFRVIIWAPVRPSFFRRRETLISKAPRLRDNRPAPQTASDKRFHESPPGWRRTCFILLGFSLPEPTGLLRRIRLPADPVANPHQAGRVLKTVTGAASHKKHMSHKQAAADQSPKELGSIVKSSEVLFRHDLSPLVRLSHGATCLSGRATGVL